MQDTVELSLAVGSDVPTKLSEVAGGAVNSGTYLTLVVRLLHADQKVSDENDTEEMILNAADFVSMCKEHVKTIQTLRRHLARISRNQGALLATVELLTAALDSTNLGPSARTLQ